MTCVHATDWALSVMHIWPKLQVHTAASMDPRKRFSAAKAAQLLTQMMEEEDSSPSSGRYFNPQRPSKQIKSFSLTLAVSQTNPCVDFDL